MSVSANAGLFIVSMHSSANTMAPATTTQLRTSKPNSGLSLVVMAPVSSQYMIIFPPTNYIWMRWAQLDIPCPLTSFSSYLQMVYPTMSSSPTFDNTYTYCLMRQMTTTSQPWSTYMHIQESLTIPAPAFASTILMQNHVNQTHLNHQPQLQSRRWSLPVGTVGVSTWWRTAFKLGVQWKGNAMKCLLLGHQGPHRHMLQSQISGIQELSQEQMMTIMKLQTLQVST